MKQDIFSVPFYHYQVQDWSNKKQRLLELFESVNKSMDGNLIRTSHNIKTNVFDDEIKKFEIDCGVETSCLAFWFQKYSKGMNHDVHHHGFNSFSSAVCFVEYNKEEHEAPVFISPFADCISGEINRFSPDVDEGDIIFFPSNLMHYVSANHSDKERLVVSFNLFSNKNLNSEPKSISYS